MMLKPWLRRMFPPKTERKKGCLGCGRCCESFGGHLHASSADIQRWQHLGRTDLLERVNSLGWIWVEPQTKKMEPRCPFLQRTSPETARCTIHEIKPDICRAYPTLAHGRRCLRGGFFALAALLANGIRMISEFAAEISPPLTDFLFLA